MSSKSKIDKKSKTEKLVAPTKAASARKGIFDKKPQPTKAPASKAVPGKKQTPSRQGLPTYPDLFVGTPEVFGLPGPQANQSDKPYEMFQSFLEDKDAIMVFFYGEFNSRSERAKVNIRQAAQSTQRPNHAYAAVDCSSQRQICSMEDIQSVPAFKLYSLGRLVGRFDEGTSAKDLQNFVETAPVPKDKPPVVKSRCDKGSSQWMR